MDVPELRKHELFASVGLLLFVHKFLYFIFLDSKRMVANGERKVGFVEGMGGVI